MARSKLPRLIPTGTCWCGCGDDAGIGAFFARGHDKIAEAALLAVQYGGLVARLLHKHGYGSERSVTAEAIEQCGWQRCSHPGCRYVGAPASVTTHAKRQHGLSA